jgi:hypothetical protein
LIKTISMKRIVLIISFLYCVLATAQVPQGVSYQAIALNSSGYPVGNTLIGVRLSILDNSVSGTEIYKETHTTTTNDRGLYNLIIGQGTPVSGQFPLIDWGTNYKFLKVELDVAGGTNYVLAGTTQLWSVPYALYSEKANSVDAANIIGETGTSYASGFLTDTNAYYIYNGINDQPNEWIQQPISGQPIEVAANYYTVGFLTSTNAYACTVINSGSDTTNTYAQWFPKQLSGTPLKMIIANESIGVLTSTHAYIFTYNVSANNVVTYNWSSQAISGTPKDIYAFGNSCIGVVTDTNAYAYAKTNLFSSPEANGSWYSTPISGTVLQVRPTVQVFSVYTSTHAYSLVPIFTSVGNTASEWKSVQMNGNYIDSSK